MICHRIGRSPISIIGFGFKWLSSLILVPKPPAKITTFNPRTPLAQAVVNSVNQQLHSASYIGHSAKKIRIGRIKADERLVPLRAGSLSAPYGRPFSRPAPAGSAPAAVRNRQPALLGRTAGLCHLLNLDALLSIIVFFRFF